MKVAFYGSSLLSSYWNGAATYYRGLLSALARRGYDWEVVRATLAALSGAEDELPADE